MGWQQRGTKRYYYRNEWREGRSVRRYLGTGEVGALAATAEALRRVQKESAVRQWRAEQERRVAATALVDDLWEQVELLVRATLLGAGYHQHDRGTWRLKRANPIQDGTSGGVCW